MNLASFWVLVDALAVGIVVLALRAAYRRLRDPSIASRPFALEGDESDAMTHLVAIDLVRRNGNHIPDETPQFLCSTGFDYPAFFHKVLSYFPRRWLERGEWLVSPGFEGAHAALVYLAAVILLSQLQPIEHVRPLALLVAAGWAVTPLLTHQPRRSSFIGERCFGYIFGHAFLFCMVMATATGEFLWVVPAALAFTIGAASSKFALQAMTFITLVFAVLRFDPAPVAVLLLSTGAAVVLSRGYVVRVISGTINHSRFYRSFLVGIHDYTSSFSTRDLAEGAKLLARGHVREAIASLKRHPVHRLPSLVPWLLPFAVFLVAAPGSGGSPIPAALIAWALAALLVALATATDTLKFLGEAERYVEFALLPLIVLSVLVPAAIGPTLLLAVFAYSLFRLGAVYSAPAHLAIAPPETIELVRWFSARPQTTVLTVPGRLCYPLVYGTSHNAVWWFINAPRGARLDQWKSLFGSGARYPYIAPAALGRARESFGAEAIAVDKAGAEAAARYWGIEYDLTVHPVLFENARYVVLDAAVSARAAA